MKQRPPNFDIKRADTVRKERGAAPPRSVQEVVRRGEVTKDATRRRGKVPITLPTLSITETE